MLIVLMGKSASGKTAVVKEMCNRGWQKVITYTTRPKRPGEVDGIDYYFISEKAFKRKVERGFFLEYKAYKVATGEIWYYGSPAKIPNHPKQIIILTPSGYREFKNKSGNIPYKSIYLLQRFADREYWAKKRGDNIDEIRRRRLTDAQDFDGVIQLADAIVVNTRKKSIKDLADEIEESVK